MEAERSKAKVVVVGGHGVGKRSLVRRSAYDPMDDRFLATLGAKVAKKEIVLPVRLRDGTQIDLILWTINPLALTKRDTAFVRGAAGILAVCDATQTRTLEELNELISPVREASGDIPLVLAVNKWDLVSQRQTDAPDAMRFAEKYAADYFCTSAITGENVEATFQALGERIVLYRRARLVARGRQGPP